MKILLDACCAPCSVPAIERLQIEFPGADIIIYANNSNIQPEEEYKKRLQNIKRIAAYYNKEVIVEEYNPDEWHEFVKGLEQEPEGGKRCEKCYEFRLKKAAEFASKNKFSMLATTLTTGPPKKAELINKIGKKVCMPLKIKFIEDDFKKKDGFLISTKKSKELNLYRQDYCGCEYSIRK